MATLLDAPVVPRTSSELLRARETPDTNPPTASSPAEARLGQH